MTNQSAWTENFSTKENREKLTIVSFFNFVKLFFPPIPFNKELVASRDNDLIYIGEFCEYFDRRVYNSSYIMREFDTCM